MSPWVTVGLATELPPGTRKTLTVNNMSILICNLEGHFYAVQNRCSHADFPLEEGVIEDKLITCPYHGAKFCLVSGEVKTPPAFTDLETYPTRVHNSLLQILIEPTDL
jgi:3-phenylpropionate/trans-cinnamate dioxygenase ferredoxin subunit